MNTAGMWRNLLTRLLEGRHVWGWYQISAPGRGGWVIIKVAVYPPGTNAEERRALTFLRNWRSLGAVLGCFALIVFGAAVPAAVLVPMVIGCYTLGILVARHWSRGVRNRVRQVNAASYFKDGTHEVGAYQVVSATIRRLEALDEQRASISPAAYERSWAEIYEALDRLPMQTRAH